MSKVTANVSVEERAFRQFLRATFRARFARDDAKHPLTSLKGKTAKAEIKNGATVLAELTEQCTVVKEGPKSTVFRFGKGKQKSTITFAHVGNANILTMVAQ